ncbi:hypothetical protein [Streptomyces sp. NPDC057854]|uniref:hypothetical protein n=1 Tax=unclassified Streptomyces TaxID=2593676 RepID=UPI0036A42BB6
MSSTTSLGDYDISIGQAPVNLAAAGSTGKRISMALIRSVDVLILKGAGAADVNEQQTINLGSATAGTITITFDGQTTGSIAYNAAAATVQAALEALSNIAPGDVTVSGGPLPGTITLTFGGQYQGVNVPQVTVTPTGLTGGTVTVSTTVQGSKEDPVITLKSHTASTGGVTTNLPVITEYYVKSEATLDGDETWTRVAQPAAATITDPGGAGTSAESQQLILFNVRADQLPDADNYLSVDIADVGSTAQLCSVVYLLHRQDKGNPTSFPAPLR